MQVEFAPRPGKSENHVVVYNDITKLQLQAAWATTVHKAQGGEVPVVVMPLHQGMSRECPCNVTQSQRNTAGSLE
jgi:ATP-dependent exoDNAse (exonuclease V) alpha subunit